MLTHDSNSLEVTETENVIWIFCDCSIINGHNYVNLSCGFLILPWTTFIFLLVEWACAQKKSCCSWYRFWMFIYFLRFAFFWWFVPSQSAIDHNRNSFDACPQTNIRWHEQIIWIFRPSKLFFSFLIKSFVLFSF